MQKVGIITNRLDMLAIECIPSKAVTLVNIQALSEHLKLQKLMHDRSKPVICC